MKMHALKYVAILALGFMTSVSLADSHMEKKPVATMAKILLDLNHYPSAKEKEKLRMIARNTNNSAAIQTIAQAIHDMQHSVSAEDRGKLQAIVDSADSSGGERELAEILLGITHYPDSGAKGKLKKLMK